MIVEPQQNKDSGIGSFLQARKEKLLQKPANKYLHTKEHLLADDLSRMLGEPNRFGSYLGISRLYFEADLRGLARRVIEKEDLPAALQEREQPSDRKPIREFIFEGTFA